MHIPHLTIKPLENPPADNSLTPDLQPASPPTFLHSQVPVPCKMGHYLITGTSNTLYTCVDLETEENLTCKVVNNEITLTAHNRLRHHPGTNPVREVVIVNSRTFLVHPPSFGDLRSHVRDMRRLPEPEAQRLFGQIVRLVAAAHEVGLVLRDLKLRKFVFSDKQKTMLKLENLDDAILADETNDQLMDRHGCPSYASPEILESSTTSYSGRAADCWSLGIMLYVMLIGRYPFHDADPSLIVAKVRKGQYKVSDTLSGQARCLIRSLLRREPNERLSAQEVLDHPWFKTIPVPLSRKRPHDKISDQTVPVCKYASF